MPQSGITSFNWFLVPAESGTVTEIAPGVAEVSIGPGEYQLALSLENPCGLTAAATLTISAMGALAEDIKVDIDTLDSTLTVYYIPESEKVKAISSFRAEVYDRNEKLLLQRNSKDGHVRFDTRQLPIGAYYLHIHRDGKVEKRQVVIK